MHPSQTLQLQSFYFNSMMASVYQKMRLMCQATQAALPQAFPASIAIKDSNDDEDVIEVDRKNIY